MRLTTALMGSLILLGCTTVGGIALHYSWSSDASRRVDRTGALRHTSSENESSRNVRAIERVVVREAAANVTSAEDQDQGEAEVRRAPKTEEEFAFELQQAYELSDDPQRVSRQVQAQVDAAFRSALADLPGVVGPVECRGVECRAELDFSSVDFESYKAAIWDISRHSELGSFGGSVVEEETGSWKRIILYLHGSEASSG